jgi:hypothetical protein
VLWSAPQVGKFYQVAGVNAMRHAAVSWRAVMLVVLHRAALCCAVSLKVGMVYEVAGIDFILTCYHCTHVLSFFVMLCHAVLCCAVVGRQVLRGCWH